MTKNKEIIFLVSFTLVALSLTIINVNSFLNKSKVLGISAQAQEINFSPSLEEEASFWANVIENNPTFRDGFIELADIYLKIGNIKRTRELINQARLIDPNSEEIKNFELNLN